MKYITRSVWVLSFISLFTDTASEIVVPNHANLPQKYTQSCIIDLTKEKIFDHSQSIREIAYAMGYKYPQHFTRLFKQRMGVSPLEYQMKG